jgi:PAS domain S-box-containing protein
LDIDNDIFAAQVTKLSEYAFFFIDVDGVIRSWNHGVERLFGYSAAEWIGQHSSIIFTPADQAIALSEAELGTAREKGCASDIRWHRKKDGTELFANGIVERVEDKSGRLAGFTKVLSDETERKRLEDSLMDANAALEHFAYAASHDLQEPLRTVHAFAQLLLRRDGDQLSSDGREHLDHIMGAVARMSGLITDLLAYAKAGVSRNNQPYPSLWTMRWKQPCRS